MANLDARWDDVVAASSLGRARVWKLYLAGASTRFAWNEITVNQVVAIKSRRGLHADWMPLKPDWGCRAGERCDEVQAASIETRLG